MSLNLVVSCFIITLSTSADLGQRTQTKFSSTSPPKSSETLRTQTRRHLHPDGPPKTTPNSEERRSAKAQWTASETVHSSPARTPPRLAARTQQQQRQQQHQFPKSFTQLSPHRPLLSADHLTTGRSPSPQRRRRRRSARSPPRYASPKPRQPKHPSRNVRESAEFLSFLTSPNKREPTTPHFESTNISDPSILTEIGSLLSFHLKPNQRSELAEALLPSQRDESLQSMPQLLPMEDDSVAISVNESDAMSNGLCAKMKSKISNVPWNTRLKAFLYGISFILGVTVSITELVHLYEE